MNPDISELLSMIDGYLEASNALSADLRDFIEKVKRDYYSVGIDAPDDEYDGDTADEDYQRRVDDELSRHHE